MNWNSAKPCMPGSNRWGIVAKGPAVGPQQKKRKLALAVPAKPAAKPGAKPAAKPAVKRRRRQADGGVDEKPLDTHDDDDDDAASQLLGLASETDVEHEARHKGKPEAEKCARCKLLGLVRYKV